MKLGHLTTAFSVALLVMLGINGGFTLLVADAYHRLTQAQAHRQQALALVGELAEETDLLGRLVSLYANTADPRFLLYYYDILGIREGDKPALPVANPSIYWDKVIAGEITHQLAVTGVPRSLHARMRALGFDGPELRALEPVLEANDALKQVEQVAFAATQGLYDPVAEEFVSEAVPDRAFARELIDSRRYYTLRLRLSEAIEALVAMVDQHTGQELDRARMRMEGWIWVSGIGFILTMVLVSLGIGVIRRDLIQPLGHLRASADRLADGQYASRIGALQGVEELKVLGHILDKMARAIAADLQQREQVQHELEVARTRAETATRAKSRFLANMSHEIRTPMNAVIGMLHLALGTELTVQQQDYIAKARSAAQSLLGILNDILDFSKVEAGRLKLDPAPFQLEQVLAEALLLVQQPAQEKGVELLLDTRDLMPFRADMELLGDALRLRQVLANLLSNAVKFTEQGRVRLVVEPREQSTTTVQLSFAVQDTGIGMSAAQTARLFTEFAQADGSTTRKYGGTGLGLAISKRLVEMMGGELQVQTRLGAGSTFHFELPFKRLTRAEAASRSSTAPDTPVHLAGMRVLLVEDNALNQQLALELLRVRGVEAEVANNGAEALERLAAQPADHFDLVLMDLQMPVLDGYDTTEHLREDARYAALPVIAMTAHALSDERCRGMRVGMQDYLAKPFEPDQLYKILAKYRRRAPDPTGLSSAPAAPPAPPASWPEIPGLDVRRGMLRAGGSQALYLQLLSHFRANYLDASTELRKACDALDSEPTDRHAHRDDILRYIHTMKGLAGTLGMHQVAHAARALEQALCRRAADKAVLPGDHIQHFSEVLEPILAHIGRLATTENTSPAAVAAESPPAAQLIEQIRALLTDGDAEAIDLWHQHEAKLATALSPDQLRQVKQALEHFDFVKAIEWLAPLDNTRADG